MPSQPTRKPSKPKKKTASKKTSKASKKASSNSTASASQGTAKKTASKKTKKTTAKKTQASSTAKKSGASTRRSKTTPTAKSNAKTVRKTSTEKSKPKKRASAAPDQTAAVAAPDRVQRSTGTAAADAASRGAQLETKTTGKKGETATLAPPASRAKTESRRGRRPFPRRTSGREDAGGEGKNGTAPPRGERQNESDASATNRNNGGMATTTDRGRHGGRSQDRNRRRHGQRGPSKGQRSGGRHGKRRSKGSGRSRLPQVPPGPAGLIYVVEANAPIGATGVVRVFFRQPGPQGQHGSAILPVAIDRHLPRFSKHEEDEALTSILLRLPRQSKAALQRKKSKRKRGKVRSSAPNTSAVTVTEKAWRTLLPLLIESGRVYLLHSGTTRVVPIVREDRPPLDFHLLLERIKKRGDFHLTCRFVRGHKTLLYKSQVLLITDGEKGQLLRRSGKLSDVEFSGSVAWLKALRRGRFRHVPKRKISSLLKIFERSTTLPEAHFPSALKIKNVTGIEPRPELKLESGPQEVDAEVTFRYGDNLVRAARPGKRFFSLKNRRLIVRNLESEGARAVELLQLGFLYNESKHSFSLSADRLVVAAPELFELGWTLHGKRMPFRPPTDMQVEVETGTDYIDVDVRVHFGDQSIKVPELMEAMQQGNRMIVLKQGVVGVLPSDWIEKNAAWMELGHVHDGKLRLRRNQSSMVDALVEENIKARLDQSFRTEKDRLDSFQGVEEHEASENFNGTLRPYQEFGVGWLRFLDSMEWGGCLADDMGLGKTIQALAHLQLLKEEGRTGTTLIVTPKSLVFNWQREAQRFTPNLKCASYLGPKRAKILEKLDEYDVIFSTYGTVRRDVEQLASIPFLYVILDEAQAIKNIDSQNARAVRVLNGQRRLILSGTPVENHLGELWSLFDFLNPGMLGTYNAFKKRFGGELSDAGGLSFLRRTLRPFILRRKKEEVAPDLPPRTEETILCQMETEQRKIYNELKERCRNSVLAQVKSKGLARSKLHILEALLRLRQAACHPRLIDDEYAESQSGKFNALIDMLEQVEDEGHKALIFSQFTSLLSIVRETMDGLGKNYEYLDGQTRNRAERVDRFQEDEDCRFFLISLKAGGVGLNLTAADYVFILDPWWNPAVEAQAIDRAHRIGQDKKVFAYRFVSESTIEERIADLQESKRKLADAIVTADENIMRDLTKDDLEVLFS